MQEQRVNENEFYLRDTLDNELLITKDQIAGMLETKSQSEVQAEIEGIIANTFKTDGVPMYSADRITVEVYADGRPKRLELRNYG